MSTSQRVSDDDSSGWQSYTDSAVSTDDATTHQHSSVTRLADAPWSSANMADLPTTGTTGKVDPAASALGRASLASAIQSSCRHHLAPTRSAPSLSTLNFHVDNTSLTIHPDPSSPSLLDRRLYNAIDEYNPRPSVYLFAPPSVTASPSSAHSPHELALSTQIAASRAPVGANQSPLTVAYATATMATSTISLSELLAQLSVNEDATRKLAAFKLQSLINDPGYAEHFVAAGGLSKLRDLILKSNGNTLAYALASFARLLEVDQGWEIVDDVIVNRAVELVVCQPLVNILRGAMSVLVSIVSRPYTEDQPEGSVRSDKTQIGGFKALKPSIGLYPQFLEMLVSRLSSADHALCANALQLINSLMRDAITVENEFEWPRFIKRIQDLGVIKAVYILMQSSALQDLAHPLLEFQALTKILLRRWKDVRVDLVKPEHRRTIKALHLSSNPEKSVDLTKPGDWQPKHNPNKWRRLGFTTESPEPDFEEMGFLGMMDLSDYVRKHQDEFQNILLEQATIPNERRCPMARASLFVTSILFEHFEVDKTDIDDARSFLILESRTNNDEAFKPLLLHWSRLHVASLHAFLRLWKATGAELEDFYKIVELIRILIESVVGGADRTKGIEKIEQELATYELSKLRELQMELLELSYEDVWGQQLRGIREELSTEAVQFVKEQRVRSLLDGEWFAVELSYKDHDIGGPVQEHDLNPSVGHGYRFIRLSADRKYLHWAMFEEKAKYKPPMGMLREKIDLASVSSVVSNITANNESTEDAQKKKYTTSKITVHGYAPEFRSRTGRSKKHHDRSASSNRKEVALLTFQPPNASVASEWLDGLLMLLDQQPITAETNKLMSMISDYGLKVRLLNVRFNDEEGLMGGIDGVEAPPIPSREGLDEDYYYEI